MDSRSHELDCVQYFPYDFRNRYTNRFAHKYKRKTYENWIVLVTRFAIDEKLESITLLVLFLGFLRNKIVVLGWLQ